MTKKRILMVGLNPSLVNFAAGSSLNAESVRAAGGAATERLRALGHEVQDCLFDPGTQSEQPLVNLLSRSPFDCIMIGAGLRALPEHTILFEKVINTIHRHAPSASICFNTNPGNTAEAVLRWIE